MLPYDICFLQLLLLGDYPLLLDHAEIILREFSNGSGFLKNFLPCCMKLLYQWSYQQAKCKSPGNPEPFAVQEVPLTPENLMVWC